MARRGHARQPPRVARSRGFASADRAVPPRRCATPQRGARCLLVVGSSRRCSGPRRHAEADVHVLPPVTDADLGDPVDVAGSRWSHDARDRWRVPRPGIDDGATHHQVEGQDQGVERTVHASRARATRRTVALRAARALPPLQRGLCQQRRPGSGTHRSVGRGHPVDAPGARRPARRPRTDRPVGPDAADRRGDGRHEPAPPASSCRWPSRTELVGIVG